MTKKNVSLIPNIGISGSMSVTPSYEESKYYSWRNRKVGNISLFFSDKYDFVKRKNNNFNLGWTLDFRSLIANEEQIYSINGTSATYRQDKNLKKEISLLANLNYEKKISSNGEITFGLDAKNTSQNVKNLTGNIGFKANF